MKTNINLSPNDQCKICNEECPKSIYDCEKLNDAINKKEAQYIWCWVPKEK